MSDGVDRTALKKLGHAERMSEKRMTKKCRRRLRKVERIKAGFVGDGSM